ncbi:MAG TPA: hypothetical protein VIP11_09965 [Gemmatimonadaceae bacterium]
MLRGSAVGIVVITFVAAATVGASAIRNASSRPDSNAPVHTDSVATAKPSPAETLVTQAAAPAATQPNRAIETPTPPFGPTLPQGESTLQEGVTAVRGDSDVVVSFDKPMTRTRRADKFEQFVRSTLPEVYGPAVGDLLDKLPVGTLSAQGDLLTELPTRGLRIPVNAAWAIRVFPETRPGQEGPLVVRYRVRLAPIGG